MSVHRRSRRRVGQFCLVCRRLVKAIDSIGQCAKCRRAKARREPLASRLHEEEAAVAVS